MNNKPRTRFRRLLLASAIGMVLAAFSARGAVSSDEESLRQLNLAYLQAYLHSDVAAYRQLLADDFVAILADGRVLDKARFLAMAAAPAPVADFRVGDIAIRQYEDAAVVTGRVAYRTASGAIAARRYTDVYVRRANRWRVVSAQLTPVLAAND